MRSRETLDALKTRIRGCAGRLLVRDYDVGFAGLRIDPSFLPGELSEAERAGLADGVVSLREWGAFSAPVHDVILRQGTVGLSGLDTLGNQILEDLWAVIEKELQRPVGVLDDHQRERAYHERFVVDRTRLFLARDEIVERILTRIADPTGGSLTVVTGAPGSGKSALLAECTRRARERFPDALVIPHFIGASPGSAILTNTLRSFCEALKRECSLTEEVPQEPGHNREQRPPQIRPMEVPEDPEKLRQKWPKFLEKAGTQRQIVLFLDALNQLDPLDHSHELGWIPYRAPMGVTLIVATLPGDCLDRLSRRVPDEGGPSRRRPARACSTSTTTNCGSRRGGGTLPRLPTKPILTEGSPRTSGNWRTTPVTEAGTDGCPAASASYHTISAKVGCGRRWAPC